MNNDHRSDVERAGSPLESRGTLRALLADLRSLEGTASPDTLRALTRRSRSLASVTRIPEARGVFGTAADAVFFETSSGRPKRSTARVEGFLSEVFSLPT